MGISLIILNFAGTFVVAEYGTDLYGKALE